MPERLTGICIAYIGLYALKLRRRRGDVIESDMILSANIIDHAVVS